MLKDQTTHSETLLEFTRLLNISLNLDEILKHLLRSILGYLLVSKGLIAIQQADETYSIVLVRGLKQVKAGDLFDKEAVSSFGIYRVYPIGNINSPIGYLGVSCPLKGEITAKEEELLEALLSVATGNITNAINHKQVQILNQELKQKNQELRAVLEFSQELSSSIEPENIIMLLALTLSGHWAVKRYAVITWKEPYPPISRQKGIILKNISVLKSTLVELPKVVFVSDLPNSELKTSLLDQGANILFPISTYKAGNDGAKSRSDTENFGVIILGQRPKKTYTKLELDFGISLVAQASIALQQAWYIREMVDRKQSIAKQIAQKQADKVFSALVDILPGTILDDKYQLEIKIGSGGFGAIYQAKHLSLNNPVAIKILRPMPGNKSLEQLERFHQEAITACKLNHPNAVTILDCCISKQGIAYIVMELLSGYSLSDFLKKERALSLSECAKILSPICSVLSHAHSISMVHRDIKPENIFIHKTPTGEVIKVVDFGLAKIYSNNSDEETKNLTQYGEVLGTPAYISPERLRGEKCDGKADIYSLGIMLYEMLSGKQPFNFRENTFFSMAMSHINDKPIPLREVNPNVPIEIEEIVMQTLYKNPVERPTAKDLAKSFLQETIKILKSNPDIDSHMFGNSDFSTDTKEIKRNTAIQQEDTSNYAKEKLTHNPIEQIKTVKAILQEDWSKKTKLDGNILEYFKNIKNKPSQD